MPAHCESGMSPDAGAQKHRTRRAQETHRHAGTSIRRRRQEPHTAALLTAALFLGSLGLSTALGSVLSLSPTAGPATGGFSVSIFGESFAAANSYTCDFSCSTVSGSYTSLATFASDSALTCTINAWESTACLSTVHIRAGGVLLNGTALQFHFGSAWTVINPRTGPASGGSALIVQGGGFSFGRTYRCNFNLTTDWMPESLTTVAFVNSPTRLLCSSPRSQKTLDRLQGLQAEISITEDAIAIPFVGGNPTKNVFTYSVTGWVIDESDLNY